MIKEVIRRQKVVSTLFYGLKIDNLCFRLGLMGFGGKIDSALKSNLAVDQLSNPEFVKKCKKDIVKCYEKYKSLPSEYFLFKFNEKDDTERSSYITDTYINSTLARVVGRKAHDMQLNDKYAFYELMKPYFKRQVVCVKRESDYAKFEDFALSACSLILKPNGASVGSGIEAVEIGDSKDAGEVFKRILQKGGEWVVEERITQAEEMSKWNKSSVNTVRISTFLTNDGFFVLSGILRTGREGSVVDNAGRGGVSAAIDPSSGVVISDGMDKQNNWYVAHPDSGTVYKGVQIPRWPELLSLADEIHRTIPNQIYVGWDFALTDNGWVLIEGNWGELGAQQVALGHGLRNAFDKYLKQGQI